MGIVFVLFFSSEVFVSQEGKGECHVTATNHVAAASVGNGNGNGIGRQSHVIWTSIYCLVAPIGNQVVFY
jgi:hypothetical protein